MPPKLASVPAEAVPAIGYVRVSMAREEMISPDIQRAALEDWARRTGRTIIAWIQDLDMSGRNFRRKVVKAIELVEKRAAVEIVVYRFDRWGRNALESMANIKRVELAGGQVQSATEPYDAETAIGKYNRHNALGLAEMQSDIISENWKAALANRVGRQLPPSGTPRFGYLRLGRIPDQIEPNRYRHDRTDPKGERYEPDYEGGTADVLVEMYDRYISLEGFRKIAIWLNSRGYRNTRGRPWIEETVKNVLDSGFGAGLLQLHDPACRCGDPSSCGRRVHVPGAHPAIIDTDTWESYLKARARRRPSAPASRYPKYRLSGLIHCGHCNSTMQIQSAASTPGHSYRCRLWQQNQGCTGVFPRRAHVEAAVVAELGRWAADIDEQRAATTARVTAVASAEVDRERLTRALADSDAALRRLAVQRAIDGDRMPAAVYEAAREELLAARAGIEAELAAVADTVTASSTDFRPIVEGVLDKWDVLSVMRIRDMLAALVRHVKVYRVDGGSPGVEVVPLWEPCDCPLCERRDA